MCRVLSLFVSLFVLCSAWGTEPPVLIAHRGGAGLGVENSISCIARSVALGVEAVEIDVRLTRDGALVVFHDARVDALTDGRGRISEMTLDEVQVLRLVDAFGCATAERIPTLGQVLAFVEGRCRVLVEAKCSRSEARRVALSLNEAIKGCDAAGWVSVQSFSDALLEELNALGVSCPLEKLFVFKVPLLPLIYDGGFRLFSLKKYGYVSSFNIHFSCLNAALVNSVHEAGKEVKVWTLKWPCDVPSLPVDGVIIDFPLRCGCR